MEDDLGDIDLYGPISSEAESLSLQLVRCPPL